MVEGVKYLNDSLKPGGFRASWSQSDSSDAWLRISFTLDGASVGTAITNSSGIATLTGVHTSDAAGTHAGVVVASFAGTTNGAVAAKGTGNLVVRQAASSLASVSGTAKTKIATLTAVLRSLTTNAGVSGQTISFTLDGKAVGSSVTNSSGIATLTGVATSDAVGTHTAVIVARFAGSSNYQAATNGTGNLSVS